MRPSRRRFAPSVPGLERRLPLDGECDCDCDMPPAEMGEIELPPIEEIFADDPDSDLPLDSPDSLPGPTPDLLDLLPVLEPEEPEPPDAELGLPPFLPLPPAPIEPAGPA